MARTLTAPVRSRAGESHRAGGLGLALLLGALGVPACGSEPPESPSPSGGSAGAGGSAGGACEFNVEAHPTDVANHLVPCTPITYDTNPPSGGPHYLMWAAFHAYDFPVPAGFLVHSLEHGAVIFWYNCPDGCADEVAQATALIDSLPLDPLCGGLATPRRAILVPSPELDTRWAVSSWGFLAKADCLDAEALRSFYTDHYGQGREDFCAAGVELTAGVCP
jgi:Protein of unknown function (DUF3105)